MKTKKVLKVILIVFISLVLVLCLSLAAIFQFVIKPHTEEITTTIEQIISDPELVGEIEQEATSQEALEDALEETPEDFLQENDLSDFLIEKIPNPKAPEEKTQQPKKQPEEYKNIYEYAKDNVNSKDFKRGMSFASRIDIAYILGLLKGGLTVPEKRELKAYLKQHFTNAEISEGVALYNKYSYLLK